jgi:nucleoside-diphosphate-sugar epimerase
MKLLLTGGAGRLGAEVIRLCVSESYSVRAFDLPNVSWGAISEAKDIEIVKGDITDPTQVAEACRGVDAVVHLAALLPPSSERNRELTMRVNVEGTSNILKALRSSRRIPLVLASSITVYGVTSSEEPPIREDHLETGTDNYSESKMMAEELAKSSNSPYTILRIAPISVADLLEPPETIPYRGDQRVEFIYLGDAARAIVSILQKPEAWGSAYNIAGGHSWQMTGAEYIRRFYAALGVEVDTNFSEKHTALDWYDTSRSRFLGYQRTSFNDFEAKLRKVAEELGLR